MSLESILHFRLLEQMGSGGMGVVYRALDTRLGRQVALKFLPESSRMDATARSRLVSEAQAAAALDHPNVGVIYSIEDDGEHPFIVMAVYDGESLRQRIDRSPLGVEEALDVALQVARGLAVAHLRGVVHRDIKPDNLFVLANGTVKILDFGLAKRDQMDGLTIAGGVVGTLDYMSPEQIRGQAVDRRTDIWALGVVLYEMLTGVSPFHAEGGMTASILRIIKDEPEPLAALRPDVPARLVAIVERALAKDRDQRYGAADEMTLEFELIRSRASASTVGPGLGPPAAPETVLESSDAVARGQAPTGVPEGAGPSPASASAPTLMTPPSSVPRAASVLPTPSTPIFGRDDELSIIATNLADPHCRVLTLFGPGGTGKTRLATEAGRRLQEDGAFADGAYFVPLDGIDDPDMIPAGVARVLGVELQPHEPAIAQLQRHIGERSMLLILDNYEHVMDGAHLPAELVQTCAGLRVLVTSRERLNLEEEWVLPIPGLLVPHLENPTHEEAEQFNSVQLFVHRAKRASLHFALVDEDPQHVCTICRLVGGSPLGIELAAAWVKMMRCEEIAREIQSSIDFLTSSSRNVSERHRSIRACFEYSWSLLTPQEQDVVARLSVFHGSFTRTAAAAVTGASLPVLGSLVDKSLLKSDAGRYESHPLLHTYAAEKLAANPQLETETVVLHGAYFRRFVEEIVGHDDELAKLDSELDNVLAAMQGASDRGDGETLVALMRLLAVDGAYYSARGHTPRSLELLGDAISKAKESGELMVAHRLLGKLGDVQKLRLGDLASALEAYEEALDLAYRLGDPQRQVVMLSLIGQSRFEQGADDADGYLSRGYEIAREHGNKLVLNHVLQHQAFLAGSRDEWNGARTLFREAMVAIEEAAKAGEATAPEIDYQKFMTLLNLGEAERMLGNHDAALVLREQALEMAEERNNRLWKAYAIHELGEVYHSMNDRESAQQHFTQAVDLWRQNHVIAKVDSLRAFMKTHGYVADERRAHPDAPREPV